MSNFGINTEKVQLSQQTLEALKKALSDNSQSVRNISNNTEWLQGSYSSNIVHRLVSISDKIMEEAAHMDSLYLALGYIVSQYKSTEETIANAETCAGNKSEHYDDNQESSHKGLFEQFLDWLKSLFVGKPEKEISSVTREQEKQHDIYMQNEIFQLLDNERFSKETWSNASLEERKQILREYLLEIEKIMGIDVDDQAHFEKIDDESTRGYYSSADNSVTINLTYLERTDSYQIMYTMIHEMRHAYQHAAVNHPESFNVSRETIEQWSNNFKAGNYKESKRDGYAAYVSQPIEYDAKNFAKQYSDLRSAKPEYRGSW